MTLSLARPGLIGDMLGGPVRAFVTGLTVLAGLILLAACANLGSLFAARAADRSKELALRLALGSSRSRIQRQLLTEAIVVSLIGGILGLGGGIILLRWLSVWHPLPDNPINVPVYPDARTYVVALLLALLSGLLFGMVPIRQLFQTDPYQIVKTGSMSVLGLRRYTLRDLLLAIQIAICAVLITASLVSVRGLNHSLHSNFGFLPENTLLVTTDISMAGYHGDQVPVMQRRMLDAIATIPASSAAYVDRVPLGLSWNDSPVFAEGTTDLRPLNMIADAFAYNISPAYFNVSGTSLISGRDFSWSDDKNAPRVAVVNVEFARKVFGSIPKAMGSYFKTSDGVRVQVVGIVEDGKYMSLTEDPRPAMFFPFLQSPSSDTSLVVRSTGGLRQLALALDKSLHSLEPALPLSIHSWHQELDSALFAPRAATVALGVLGGLGTMLALTGIFGLASYSVSKRLPELGIRVALGAQPKDVLFAALGRIFTVLVFGSVVGILGGLAVTKILASLVYQATPSDPVVLAGVVFAMLCVGLAAGWFPARRALAADPLLLLRQN